MLRTLRIVDIDGMPVKLLHWGLRSPEDYGMRAQRGKCNDISSRLLTYKRP